MSEPASWEWARVRSRRERSIGFHLSEADLRDAYDAGLAARQKELEIKLEQVEQKMKRRAGWGA